MPWTNFPNGISVTTETGTVSGRINATTITAGTVSATGGIFTTITATSGSVYGARSNIVADGSMTVTITSALYVTGALVAPFTGLAEIVLLQGATGSITRSVRIVGGVDSTGTAATTLTVGSATSQASTLYTTIGGTVISQGSQFVITSAITATANTALLTVNFIAVAS